MHGAPRTLGKKPPPYKLVMLQCNAAYVSHRPFCMKDGWLSLTSAVEISGRRLPVVFDKVQEALISCEFVCQISILISAAAIVKEKTFSVERIATRQADESPSRAAVAGILTPTRPQVQWRRGLGFASGPVQCCGVKLLAENPFRHPLHSCPVVVVDHDLSKLQCCPSPWRLPAPGAWRETSPTKAKIADLDVQAGLWTLHSGDKVQLPAWGVSPASGDMPRRCQQDMNPEANHSRTLPAPATIPPQL